MSNMNENISQDQNTNISDSSVQSPVTCSVIRDLIPSYIDGLTSPESNEMVRAHLSTCEECRKMYEEMCEDLEIAEPTVHSTGQHTDRMSEKKAEVSNALPTSEEEKRLFENINHRMKRDARRKMLPFQIGLVAVLLLWILFSLPLRSIPASAITIRYSLPPVPALPSYEVTTDFGSEYFVSVETYHFRDGRDDSIFLMDDGLDLNQALFHRVAGLEYLGLDVFVEESWMATHPNLTIVQIVSAYPIKSYDYSVQDQTFVLEKALTTLGSKPSIGDYCITVALPCDIRGAIVQ